MTSLPHSTIIFRAAATLGASVLGTGVLAQPHIVKETGLPLFLLGSALVIYASHITCVFFVRTCETLKKTATSTTSDDAQYSTLEDAMAMSNGRNLSEDLLQHDKEQSYASVVGQVLGQRGRTAISLTMIIQQFGACVAYVVVIGDVFTPLAQHWGKNDHVSDWTVRLSVCFLLILPLTLFTRDLNSLRYTSAGAVIAICVFGLTVIFNSFEVIADLDKRAELVGVDTWTDSKRIRLWPHGSGFIRTIPHFVFAYFMHFNTVQTHNQIIKLLAPEIEGSNQGDDDSNTQTSIALYTSSSLAAFAISGTITVLIGTCGYITFLNEVDTDILNNFRVEGTYISSVMNVVRAMYGLGLVMAFPVVAWEARANIFDLVLGPRDSYEVPKTLFYGITLIYVSCATLLGCVLSDLGMVFGLVGSTATPMLAFVIPCYLYMNTGAADKYGKRLMAQVILWCGVVMIPLGVVVWFLDHVGKVWDD